MKVSVQMACTMLVAMFVISGMTKVLSMGHSESDRFALKTGVRRYAAHIVFLAGLVELYGAAMILAGVWRSDSRSSERVHHGSNVLVVFTIVATLIFYTRPFKYKPTLANMTAIAGLVLLPRVCYFKRLAVSAFRGNPSGWASTVRRVAARELRLPAEERRTWHDVLSICLKGGEHFARVSTNDIAQRLVEGINKSLGDGTVTAGTLETVVLKMACVLLRLGHLNNDPKLSRLALGSGCVRSTALDWSTSQPNDSQVRNMVSRIKNAYSSDGSFANEALLSQIHSIVRATPPSKLKALLPIVMEVRNMIVTMYDYVYFGFASKKSGKIPSELLLLFKDVESFRESIFYIQIKLLTETNGKQTNVTAAGLPRLVLNRSQSNASKAAVARGILKHIHHAQALLHFHDTLKAGGDKRTKVMAQLVRIVSLFEQTAPNSKNLLTATMINVGNNVRRASTSSSSSSSSNFARLALAQQMFRK